MTHRAPAVAAPHAQNRQVTSTKKPRRLRTHAVDKTACRYVSAGASIEFSYAPLPLPSDQRHRSPTWTGPLLQCRTARISATTGLTPAADNLRELHAARLGERAA